MDILISGASSGIGRATAVHLARTGHTVWAGVRNEKSFNEIQKANVRGLNPVYLDVTNEQSIQDCLRQIKKTSGLIHGLVNNAGIGIAGPLEAVPIEEWRRQFEINVFGQIRVTQVCLPLLRESKGRIVNISSISGLIAPPLLGPYSASKFALEAVSDSLRRELREFGVHVAVVEPGPIKTPIWRRSLAMYEEMSKKCPPEILAVYARSIEKFKVRAQQAERDASPVSVVVKAIEHALTSRTPRNRYPVGKGIKFLSYMVKALPETLVDRVVS